MNKLCKIVMLFAFFFAFSTFSKTVVTCSANTGNTLYVGGAGVGNYTAVQDAINDSFDNDTIYVYNGTYVENVVVNRSIDLIGLNKTSVFIEGNGSLYVFLIRSSFVNLSEFTIQNADAGLLCSGSEYLFNNFSNNIFINNLEGMRLVNSSNNIIYNNTFYNNSKIGIVLYDSSFNRISENFLINNAEGLSLDRWSNNNVINSNNFTGNELGISFSFSFNNFITNNWIGYCEYGIYLSSSEDNNITNNDIEHSTKCGIYLSESEKNEISSNNFLDNYADLQENSLPPEIRIPGFEILVFVLATIFIIFIKKCNIFN